MTRKNLLVLVIVVIAALAASVMVFSVISKKPDKEVPFVPVDHPETAVRPKAVPFKTEKVIADYYTLDLEYPQASVGTLEGIDSYVSKVKSDFFDLVPKNEAEAEEIGMGKDHSYTIKMDTTVYTSSSTITYKLETYMYTGGAHGGTFVTTFTYDREGKLVSLDSILAGTGSLSKLSAAARTYFNAKVSQYTQKDTIEVGTEPKAENFSAWYITDAGITFVMQQYQIGPYTLGIQEFPLSRVQSKEILR